MGDFHLRRLDRQLQAMSRASPLAARIVRLIRFRLSPFLRIPVGLILVAGSVLAFLPILGLWMLPLGLLVLAIDVPVLRPAISAGMIRLRRAVARWRRRFTGR